MPYTPPDYIVVIEEPKHEVCINPITIILIGAIIFLLILLHKT